MMDSDKDKTKGELDQNSAVQFFRFLWVAYNNINMYGPSHNLAIKGVERYYNFLQETLKKISPLTLHIEGEHLLCEKWKMSQSVDVSRLVERLKSVRINSITFYEEVSQTDILKTFKIITDAKNYHNIDDISQALHDQEVKGIGLNIFVYKKVTVDEVGEDKKPEGQESDVESSKGKDKQFEEIVENLMDRFFVKNGSEPLSLLDQLEILRERVCSRDEKSKAFLPIDEILNALMYLKSIKPDNTDTTLEIGHMAKPGKEIFFELELLTFELVTKFIQDKYRSGSLSVKQFGSIIKNLFPQADDLKILFPKIKEVLMANGMTLPDYLKFVHETSIELEEGGFLNLIEQIGGDIGVSVKEITDDLKKNPNVPVQLIILTFKIFSMLGINREQIISILNQSIGLVIQRKTLEHLKNSKIENFTEIRDNLFGIEDQFLQDMESEGINKDLLHDIKNHLLKRSNILTGQIWSEWVINKVSGNKALSESEQIKMLTDIINQNKESQKFINYLLIALEEKSYKKELLNDLIKNISGSPEEREKEGIKTGSKTELKRPGSVKLPKDISNLRETKAYLQTEINRNHRHKTSFSCISISVAQVKLGSEIRFPTTADLKRIFQVVTKILTHSLRKIDFIGSLGSLKDNYILIIMTMTDEIECQKAEERISGLLSRINIKTNGSVLVPDMCISAMSFIQEKTPDMKILIRKLKADHKKKKKLLKNHSEKNFS